MNYTRWDEPDIGSEEIDSVLISLRSGWVGSNGPMVKQFEMDFARAVGAKYAIAVSNGTAALLTALLAFRIRMGNIAVGVPSFTFIATANTAAEVCGDIRLIDCSRKTWNVEKELVPTDIGLLMTVDVGGLPCNYDALKEMGIPIIADSAESAGALYKGKPVGSQADVHCFSLHRAKIITTGEGGVITTNQRPLYELMRSIANHGYAPGKKKWEYKHHLRAFNFRMTDLEAAIGIAQLRKLERYVAERRRKAEIYKEALAGLAEFQDEPEYGRHPYFFFGILPKVSPDRFCRRMAAEGIDVKQWAAVHRQTPYKHLRVNLPEADRLSRQAVLLPIHNRMLEKDVRHVAKVARRLLK